MIPPPVAGQGRAGTILLFLQLKTSKIVTPPQKGQREGDVREPVYNCSRIVIPPRVVGGAGIGGTHGNQHFVIFTA